MFAVVFGTGRRETAFHADAGHSRTTTRAVSSAGPAAKADIEACRELGATVAAGLAADA